MRETLCGGTPTALANRNPVLPVPITYHSHIRRSLNLENSDKNKRTVSLRLSFAHFFRVFQIAPVRETMESKALSNGLFWRCETAGEEKRCLWYPADIERSINSECHTAL